MSASLGRVYDAEPTAAIDVRSTRRNHRRPGGYRMLIQGSCHCGNISFTLTWEPEPAEIQARACGCSFCAKHGGQWTSNPSGALNVMVKDSSQVSKYTFGTRAAEFHTCGRCGVVAVVTSRIDGRLYAVVNVNAFEGIDPSRIRRLPTNFDGEERDARLARWKRNWISNVEFGGADAVESARP